MSRDFFIKILEQLQGYTRHLMLHVLGEPLLHPELGLFLDLCREYGYLVSITTNGLLIHTAGRELLSKPALRQVNFSLRCAEANTGRFSLEEYLGGLFSFIDAARQRPDLYISLRLWNAGAASSPEKNQPILSFIEKIFPHSGSLSQRLTEHSSIKLAPSIFLNQAKHFMWPDINGKDFGGQGFCRGLRDHIAVLAGGTVVPCCLDSEGTINLGDINKISFADILAGSRARNLYDGFSRQVAVEPLCRRCSYRLRFTENLT